MLLGHLRVVGLRPRVMAHPTQAGCLSKPGCLGVLHHSTRHQGLTRIGWLGSYRHSMLTRIGCRAWRRGIGCRGSYQHSMWHHGLTRIGCRGSYQHSMRHHGLTRIGCRGYRGTRHRGIARWGSFHHSTRHRRMSKTCRGYRGTRHRGIACRGSYHSIRHRGLIIGSGIGTQLGCLRRWRRSASTGHWSRSLAHSRFARCTRKQSALS